MTKAKLSAMTSEPTVAEVARKFGVTQEQVRAQYRRNAEKMHRVAASIRAGGSNPNDYDPDDLDARANDYALKGKEPCLAS